MSVEPHCEQCARMEADMDYALAVMRGASAGLSATPLTNEEIIERYPEYAAECGLVKGTVYAPGTEGDRIKVEAGMCAHVLNRGREQLAIIEEVTPRGAVRAMKWIASVSDPDGGHWTDPVYVPVERLLRVWWDSSEEVA